MRIAIGVSLMSHQTQPKASVITVMVMGLLLGGCKVGRITREAPVADGWLETDNPGVKPEGSDNYKWWEVFDDPVLDDLIERAYDQNTAALCAQIGVAAAREKFGRKTGRCVEAHGPFRLFSWFRSSPRRRRSSPRRSLPTSRAW